MAKFLGIIRYEILMGWRRGSSRVIFFVPILMPILGFVLFTNTAFRKEQIATSQLSAEMAQRVGTAIALMDTIFLIPMMIFLVPVLVAEVIPLDRQYKMAEMLRSLPLTTGTYLTGKVASVLVQVVASLTATAAISIAIQSIRNTSLDAKPLVLFWVGGVLALGLFTSIAGVILPAMQPNRRRAVLMGWLVAFISMGIYTLLPIYDILVVAMIQTAAIGAAIPINPASLPDYPTLIDGAYLWNYQLMAASLVLIWGFMAWRLRNSEGAR